jgi:L,D-peptidoglycan transpeptidase YkuD (ErfK/YbiS/YcfS/YnhG family)
MARPVAWARADRARQDGWSDDPARSRLQPGWCAARIRFGHERLARADPLYDLVLLTDWNWLPAARGAGSAIFLHRWRAPGVPTAGCIALDPGPSGSGSPGGSLPRRRV